MRVHIVGAGPSGSYAGMLLAKAGHDVTIYDDHKKIGEPVACTGIVTKGLFDLVKYNRDFVINELDGVDVIGPRGEKARIPLKEYVICRKKFDNYLANKARDAGARILLGHRYVGRESNAILFRHNGSLVRQPFEISDILIGADGPFSRVAETSGLSRKRKYYVGQQATIKGAYDPHFFTTWFGNIAPGFFCVERPGKQRILKDWFGYD